MKKTPEIKLKLSKLESILIRLKKVVVAFSGGLDSSLLLFLSTKILGKENVVGIMALSKQVPDWDIKSAMQISQKVDCKVILYKTNQLKNENFVSNPPNRCFYCKNETYTACKEIASLFGIKWILSGTNLDDLSDFRPGLESAKKYGVRHPFCEAELTKKDIREISKMFGLVEIEEKPSSPCLASRIPYGTRITEENLEMVHLAEKFMMDNGFKEIRVRNIGNIAKIEIPKSSFEKFLDSKDYFVNKLKQIGFAQVCLDMEGLRRGSMNELVLEL